MTDLSPAAQAVVNAVDHYETNHWLTPREVAAAALRAAASKLRQAYANEEYVDHADDWLDSIATELEAHQ